MGLQINLRTGHKLVTAIDEDGATTLVGFLEKLPVSSIDHEGRNSSSSSTSARRKLVRHITRVANIALGPSSVVESFEKNETTFGMPFGRARGEVEGNRSGGCNNLNLANVPVYIL